MKRTERTHLLKAIGDCLDYCTDTECQFKRTHNGDRLDENCFDCMNYKRMQKHRQALEGADAARNTKAFSSQRAGVSRTVMAKQREERLEIIHREAKKGTDAAEVRRMLDMEMQNFVWMMKEHVNMSYTNLVKFYRGEL